MKLSNNMFGRLQLLLQKLGEAYDWDKERGYELSTDERHLALVLFHALEMFSRKELESIYGPMKDIYNAGKEVKIEAVREGEK